MASSWVPGGNDPPINQGGFWVTKPNLPPDQNGNPKNGANAFLENSAGARVFLWVNNVQTDFAMTGKTAQSKAKRSFFPHNFAQTPITVSGQTPNSMEYNRLGAFVRDSHKRAMTVEDHVLKLFIADGGHDTKQDGQRGSHKHIACEGYIASIQRGAERWVNAPDYQFQFIITQAFNFLGQTDNQIAGIVMNDILEAINKANPPFKWEQGKPDNSGSQGNHPDSQDNWNQVIGTLDDLINSILP